MKSRLILRILLPMMAAVLLTGCSGPEPVRELTGVELDRGHGSMWGYQFYIRVNREEVESASWFQESAEGEFITVENVSIDQGQWQKIESMVLEMLPQMEEVKPRPIKDLIDKMGMLPQVLDGGVYRNLTLTWSVDGETEEVEYVWTSSSRQMELEAMLEQLANTLPTQ